jgi:hypothetical protein
MVSFQPLYNQPSDTAIYHENKRRYVLFRFVSYYLFEVTIAVASHVVYVVILVSIEEGLLHINYLHRNLKDHF